MKVLLDTHLLLWAALTPQRLPAAARTLLEDARTVPLFSAASIWEVATKAALGREDFTVDAGRLRRGLADNGWEEVTVTGEHAAATGRLPLLHRDPFDRLLIAQAGMEGVLLLTSDALIARYAGPVMLV